MNAWLVKRAITEKCHLNCHYTATCCCILTLSLSLFSSGNSMMLFEWYYFLISVTIGTIWASTWFVVQSKLTRERERESAECERVHWRRSDSFRWFFLHFWLHLTICSVQFTLATLCTKLLYLLNNFYFKINK